MISYFLPLQIKGFFRCPYKRVSVRWGKVDTTASSDGKGAELGASVALELDGVTYCPLHDHRGNIIVLVDAQTGHIAESYRYTAFGECETYNHKQQQIEKTAVSNPWGYASKRLDPETGFVYFSRRYYAPTTGRWITPDPIGFADGPNMYAYVHGNPMTHFDLYGLQTSSFVRGGAFGLMGVFWGDEADSEMDQTIDIEADVLNAIESIKKTWNDGVTQEHLDLLKREVEGFSRCPAPPVGSAAPVLRSVANRAFGLLAKYFGNLKSEVGYVIKQPSQLQGNAFDQLSKLANKGQATARKINEAYKGVAKTDYLNDGGGTFRRQLTPSDAIRYDRYWTKRAPEQSYPHAMYRRYTSQGDIKQVTTYDGFGNRHRQYDFIDPRREPHQHNFTYDSRNTRPRGERSDHLPIDE